MPYLQNFVLTNLKISFYKKKITDFFLFFCIKFFFFNFVKTEFSKNIKKHFLAAGLPQGQEKLRNDKSQVKMGVFEKSQEI